MCIMYQKAVGWFPQVCEQLRQKLFRIQPICLRCGDDGIQRRTAFCPVCRIAEQPVLSPDRKRSDRILCTIVINRHIAVTKNV